MATKKKQNTRNPIEWIQVTITNKRMNEKKKFHLNSIVSKVETKKIMLCKFNLDPKCRINWFKLIVINLMPKRWKNISIESIYKMEK